ncbi:uncharacterized protein SETTUDRAFT_157326 [Exserohilum turcica Et28A]|uniref:Uncharacterized protein n=1 Tax=Exserohilum turcicum (strain 28A) TaxID=671987 RepID=R0JYR7_EXST2|nr:uncharacterized protein SETTUDRAFT_157326 [Exserohilum turcica Et28A]EOA81392.1 hypothetical protein SETTUDRAFT_157326 [Exserohilum turcica Et28A]
MRSMNQNCANQPNKSAQGSMRPEHKSQNTNTRSNTTLALSSKAGRTHIHEGTKRAALPATQAQAYSIHSFRPSPRAHTTV